MSVDGEMLELEREVQACDVRLGLLPPFESAGRNNAFREELVERRARATRRLAELEAARAGSSDLPAR